MLNRLIYILIFWITGCFLAIPQEKPSDEKSPFIMSLRLHYGMIIPHSDKIEHLSHTEPWGVELDFSWHLTRRNIWEYCFCYPRSGISLFYTNYGNPEIIGSSISLYPYIEPFIGAQRKMNFGWEGLFYPNNLEYIYMPLLSRKRQFINGMVFRFI